MPTNYKDVVDSKRLTSGAKIIYFSDGKYKFIPSRNYVELKEKSKFKRVVHKIEPQVRREHCDKLIDNIFQVLLQNR